MVMNDDGDDDDDDDDDDDTDDACHRFALFSTPLCTFRSMVL